VRLNRASWVVLVGCLLVLVAPSGAAAAPRMLLGFHDDPTFRWSFDSVDALDDVQEANASIIRATASWRAIAPRRPGRPADSFDPAYRFGDLDDLVRNAQKRGLQMMITVWGTPGWANGGRRANVPPTRPADLTSFARAIADRYSGRHNGYPYVGRYSIWNEPNLEIFLQPQFDARGTIVSPRIYAGLYKAGYRGIKAGNSGALVAIGETSNRGRDHPARGSASESVAPGTFARLLAQQKGLKFDAYATHPYSTHPSAPPTQKVRWPNVTLSQLARFETSIDAWFGRANIPVWITEYGYQTKPGEPFGVTNAQQAIYLAQVIRQLKADPRVHVFIWFVFRDSLQSPWQSGLVGVTGSPKPAYRTFSTLARTIEGETLTIKPMVAPTIKVPVPQLAYGSAAGSTIGVTYRVYDGRKLVAVAQPAPRLQIDQSISFVARFRPARRKTYTIVMDMNDIHGNGARVTYCLMTPRARPS
jgi:Cellulase (glycosyl hydrolase family 5)